MEKQGIEITENYIKEKVSKGKPYCLLIYLKGPNYDTTGKEVQMAHLRHLFQLREEGKLLLNGPVNDNSDISGIGIFSITDINHVRELVAADPAVKAGRLTFELYNWFGLPGDTLI